MPPYHKRKSSLFDEKIRLDTEGKINMEANKNCLNITPNTKKVIQNILYFKLFLNF